MLSLRTNVVLVQEARIIWKSRWVASCLPRSERFLKRHRDLLDTIVRAEAGDYRSAMDAAVAAILPELHAPMAAFYEGRGRPLIDYPPEQVERFDARLAAFLAALVPLGADARVAALIAARADADPGPC